jgi:hypothetical protein
MGRNAIVGLLCLVLAACVPSQPSPSSPTSSAGITFDCQSADYCSAASKQALLASVADLGYPVRAVMIGIYGLNCGAPFRSSVALCPLSTDPLPTAYVTFIGTDKVAAVQVGTVTGGPGTDSVAAFEVPPEGWSIP